MIVKKSRCKCAAACVHWRGFHIRLFSLSEDFHSEGLLLLLSGLLYYSSMCDCTDVVCTGIMSLFSQESDDI